MIDNETLLIWLIQETSEVTKAATKIMIFGEGEPLLERFKALDSNSTYLAKELGELQGIIDEIAQRFSATDARVFRTARVTKVDRVLGILQELKEQKKCS